MKTIEKYQCDFCGHIYNTEEEATNCESKHKTEFTVTGLDYPDIAKIKNGYPIKVIMHFEGDSETTFVEYSFHRYFSKKVNKPENEHKYDEDGNEEL